MIPIYVKALRPDDPCRRNQSESHPLFTAIACGSNYSLALDSQGIVWSWGGLGGSVLGHGETITSSYMDVAFSYNQKIVGTDSEVPPFDWLRPQPILSFASGDIVIQSISAGCRHCAAVSESGDLFLWGDTKEGSSVGNQIVLATPSNLPRVGDQVVESVYCGDGTTYAISCGSFLGQSLRALALGCAEITLPEDVYFESGYRAAYFDESIACDCALIVSGKVIYGHKIILGRRSTVLRDMIIAEERAGRAVEVIIPQLRYEVAYLMVEYLYCDNLFSPLDPTTPTPRDLMNAAVTYKLPRLYEICRSVLLSEMLYRDGKYIDGDADTIDLDSLEAHTLPSKLSYDIMGALGDTKWTDVKLIAEDKAVYAHKCILSARSQYFHAMFSSGMRESNMKEIVVEDSHVGLLRLLTFIYSDSVRPATEDILLEDLITADRYGLKRMKLLCEHMIKVTPENCVNVLAVAELVRANRLKEVAFRFILRNLNQVYNSRSFKEVSEQMPSLKHQILQRIQRENNRALLMDWNAKVHQIQQDKEKKRKDALGDPEFPLVQYAMLIVAGFSFLALNQQTESVGLLVPILNTLLFLVVLMAACFSLSRDNN